MGNVIINDVGAVEQPQERQFDPASGFVTVRRFKGQQADIEFKESELQFMGYATTVRQGPVWELEGRIALDIRNGGGQQDTPIDNWELMPNIVEKDLLQSDSVAIANITQEDMYLLRDILDGRVDLQQYRTSSPPFTSPGAGDPVGVFKLIASGVKSKLIYQTTLRHTKTVSRAYEIPASLAGYGQVFSAAQVISLNGVPSSIAAQMEASAYKTRNDGTLVYKGWLKSMPTVQISAYGKSQIVTEWAYGEWAALLYTINP